MADADPAATLGEVIRRQRELNRLSMRQFAQMAGISNPYLSQIERGLRAPSQRVVDAIARSLETSTDALYEQAGLSMDAEPEETPGVRSAARSTSHGTRRTGAIAASGSPSITACPASPAPPRRW